MASAVRHQDATADRRAVGLNLAGQRLGRKGQETRERVLVAALRLFDDPHGPPVTLTSVAREASMRLSNLYLYFPDMIELLLAVLERVMADADAAFMDHLRTRWPDDRLGQSSAEFIRAHFLVWKQHARLLQLRNALSDSEPRIMEYRQSATQPILQFLMLQMDGCNSAEFTCANLAIVVLTGFERVAAIVTNPNYGAVVRDHTPHSVDDMTDQLIAAAARLLELAIRDQRAASHHVLIEDHIKRA